MKIIISGAISNDDNYIAKFAAVEKKLQERFPKVKIFNPARHCYFLIKEGIIDITRLTDKQIWLKCMIICLPHFHNATHIYYTDNFTSSAGREIERITAKHMGLIEIQEELK